MLLAGVPAALILRVSGALVGSRKQRHADACVTAGWGAAPPRVASPPRIASAFSLSGSGNRMALLSAVRPQ
jgi:hypothetical protein